MKVGDLVTMNNQNWTTTPFLVIEKSLGQKRMDYLVSRDRQTAME